MQAIRVLTLALPCLACANLPHVDPAPRKAADATAALVKISVTCEQVGFPLGEFGPQALVEWRTPSTASGVIISGRHVLTAAHAVSCPSIPSVRVTLADGRALRFLVERDDVAFGAGADIARLEIASADNIAASVVPPALTTPQSGEHLCAYVGRLPRPCGAAGLDPSVVYWMSTRPGDSGAGVYDLDGYLVGLVSASLTCADGRDCGTRIAPVEARWLEGT